MRLALVVLFAALAHAQHGPQQVMLSFGSSGGGSSTITVPQGCVGHGTNSNDATCTFASPTTAGSAVACSIAQFDASTASATVSDNNSNTYTFDANSGASSDANNGWWITYGIAGRSSHAVTVTQTGDSPSLACFEITHTMSPIDQHAGQYPGTSSTAITVSAVTPSQNNEIVLSSLAHLGGSSWTATGFGNYQEYVFVMGESFGITAGYVIQGTAAARDAAWVAGAGSSTLGPAARTITLKESTGVLSLSTLTDGQLAAMSNSDLAAMTN